MREIFFRGKRIDNGDWVSSGNLITFNDEGEGKLFFIPQQHAKCTCAHEDQPNIPSFNSGVFYKGDSLTVGQFTGLTDKNGIRIFDGDIIECWSEGVKARGTVQQNKGGLWIIYPAWQKRIMWGLCPDADCSTDVEIIGNIYDNPELVEVDYA